MLVNVQRLSNIQFGTVVGAAAPAVCELTVLPLLSADTLIAPSEISTLSLSVTADLTVQTAIASEFINSIDLNMTNAT